MIFSDQFYVPAALLPGKQLLIPTE